MNPTTLSRQLREGSGSLLRRRRQAAVLSLVAAASMGFISLYQFGIIKHLPDPPLPGFDSDTVDAAGEAYAIGATPDAVLGLANYGVTMILAAMGGPDRARRQPWIPLAWTLKALIDAVQAARLTVDQVRRHQALCVWCLVAAGATFVTLPLTFAEARVALRRLIGW